MKNQPSAHSHPPDPARIADSFLDYIYVLLHKPVNMCESYRYYIRAIVISRRFFQILEMSVKCLVGEMCCRQNVRRPNVCRPNVCRLIVRAPIHTKHIKRYIYKLYKKYLKYSSSFKTIGPCMLCIDRNAAFLKWFSCRTVITFPLEIHGNTEHKQLGLLYK